MKCELPGQLSALMVWRFRGFAGPISSELQVEIDERSGTVVFEEELTGVREVFTKEGSCHEMAIFRTAQ